MSISKPWRAFAHYLEPRPGQQQLHEEAKKVAEKNRCRTAAAASVMDDQLHPASSCKEGLARDGRGQMFGKPGVKYMGPLEAMIQAGADQHAG
jgi:hypothetical protein